MAIKLKDIQNAFDFVSFAEMGENLAFLDRETGKIYWYSEFGDNEEELPENIDDEQYIEIPHKNELELGKRLVLEFAYTHLPSQAEKIEEIFSRKGAYTRFKDLLTRVDALDGWYEFEAKAQENALRAWCKENEIKFQD
jgi:hypothetical protein